MSPNIQEYRRKLTKRGFKRVEVSVPSEDASLIRRMAKALTKGGPSADAVRHAIDEKVAVSTHVHFEEWLAALPDE